MQECRGCHSYAVPTNPMSEEGFCWRCQAVRDRTPGEVAAIEDVLDARLYHPWENYAASHVIFTPEGWLALSTGRWKSWDYHPTPYRKCCRCGDIPAPSVPLKDLTYSSDLDMNGMHFLMRVHAKTPLEERRRSFAELTSAINAVCPKCLPSLRGILKEVQKLYRARYHPTDQETPMSRKTKINSSADLRRVLADALIDVRDGKLDVEKGNSMSRMAAQLNESVRLDLQAAVLLNRAGQTETAEGALLLTAGSTISKKLPFTPIPR